MLGVFGLHLLAGVVEIALLVAHLPHQKSPPYEFSYEILELHFFLGLCLFSVSWTPQANLVSILKTTEPTIRTLESGIWVFRL